jgi:hypothetical protein
MYPLKVLVGVSVTFPGTLLMKLLEHHKHFKAETFQEQPTGMQEILHLR